MAMDLSSVKEDRYFRVGSGWWRQLLKVAYERGGWQPRGVVAHNERLETTDERSMDGYFTNDSYLVDDEDAAALASALDRVIRESKPSDFTSEMPDPATIMDLAAFAKAGAFRIG